jgi:outer membrane immunogenic protein
MKKILLGAIGAIALSLSAPANAADLAPYAKAPAPMIAAIYDWSGFYIGLNGGGGSARKCWDNYTLAGAFVGSEGCHNATGGTVGGQLGYRMQSGNWVFGVEGQGNWADFSGSNTSVLFPAQLNRSRVDAFGLLTGQVGYAWNNVLFYVKGGGAVVSDKYDIFTQPGGVLLASARETRWGGTVGAGLEVGFAPNWSVGVEYNHIFTGSNTRTLNNAAAVAFQSDRISQDVDLGLIRVNYRWGGPIIAKY